MDDINIVVSEVHIFSKGEPTYKGFNGRAVLSRFDFTYPHGMHSDDVTSDGLTEVPCDKDGDLEVIRRENVGLVDDVILIEHQTSTSLELVGEQIWRGAFYLSDFILHNWKSFEGKNVLELASGVGLASIVAAMVSSKVVSTDVDRGEILSLLRRNLERNKERCSAETSVTILDFYDRETVVSMQEDIEATDIILAADVVYNDKLTEAFFEAVLHLMKPRKILYVALEKRYVFTIEDLDTVAPCYEFFVTKLQELEGSSELGMKIVLEEISAKNIPQYFAYERTKELVLWKISAFPL